MNVSSYVDQKYDGTRTRYFFECRQRLRKRRRAKEITALVSQTMRLNGKNTRRYIWVSMVKATGREKETSVKVICLHIGRLDSSNARQ